MVGVLVRLARGHFRVHDLVARLERRHVQPVRVQIDRVKTVVAVF